MYGVNTASVGVKLSLIDTQADKYGLGLRFDIHARLSSHGWGHQALTWGREKKSFSIMWTSISHVLAAQLIIVSSSVRWLGKNRILPPSPRQIEIRLSKLSFVRKTASEYCSENCSNVYTEGCLSETYPKNSTPWVVEEAVISVLFTECQLGYLWTYQMDALGGAVTPKFVCWVVQMSKLQVFPRFEPNEMRLLVAFIIFFVILALFLVKSNEVGCTEQHTMSVRVEKHLSSLFLMRCHEMVPPLGSPPFLGVGKLHANKLHIDCAKSFAFDNDGLTLTYDHLFTGKACEERSAISLHYCSLPRVSQVKYDFWLFFLCTVQQNTVYLPHIRA